jgi:hypothetical protein
MRYHPEENAVRSWFVAVLILILFTQCEEELPTKTSIRNVTIDLTKEDLFYRILFSDDNFLYEREDVKFADKRLIYIHGGVTGASNHLEYLMSFQVNVDFVDSLNSLGWQVIEFDLPKMREISDYWHDGGHTYAMAYRSKLMQVVQWAERTLGHCDNYYIGGVSFGGLHALFGTEHLPIFKKYFALVPVIKINRLEEFKHYPGVPYFDPTNKFEKLADTEGFLYWNKSDTRVGTNDIERLCLNLKGIHAPLDTLTASAGGHTLPERLDFLIEFLER